MKSEKRTLHIFGGGSLVGVAESIAIAHGWSVVLRTGARFVGSLPQMDGRTRVLVGNDLRELMEQGGMPEENDLGLSISAPWVFKSDVIRLFHGRLFNIHNQPLPIFRGAGGSSWRILMNNRSGGVCIHFLTEGIDSGDIVFRTDFEFPTDCRFPADFDRVTFDYSSKLLSQWLTRTMASGDCDGTALVTDYDKSEYWPRLNGNIHGWINWTWSLADIQSFCHAFSFPHKGALTTVRGQNVFIRACSFEQERKFHPFQSGLIYRIANNELRVAHPDGTLIVQECEIADPGVRIRLGDRFVTPTEKLEMALATRIQYSPDGSLIGN